MLLVSDRPLLIRDDFRPGGIPFEVDPDYAAHLLKSGVARHAAPPQILYENQTREQNAAALREQGITCLCLTRNRPGWLPVAIAAYIAQSYQPRELLIIADGADVRGLIPEREDIRLIHVEEGRTIGEKRNFGVSLAVGKYVAHWDDDDRSASDRLRDQIDRIRPSGKPVTGYQQLDFTDGPSWWRYSGDANHAPGSSLLYEREWALAHPFPSIQIGEDGEFVKYARERGQIVVAPSHNGMLTATIHPGNTTPHYTGERFWKPLERSKSGLTVIIPSKTLSNIMPCVEAIAVHDREPRVVVVDDGIEWPVPEHAQDVRDHQICGKPVDVVRGEKPFNFSRNINIGILEAGRDDVLLLNDDALLKTQGGFTVLQKAAQEHPEFGLIAATTNAVGNRNQLPRGIGLREENRMLCFVCVLIPRTTLDRIGYLDERYACYSHQDDDFCYRVKRAGLKLAVHDGCFVDHNSLVSSFRGPGGPGGELETGRRIFHDKWGVWPV